MRADTDLSAPANHSLNSRSETARLTHASTAGVRGSHLGIALDHALILCSFRDFADIVASLTNCSHVAGDSHVA